MQGFLRFNKIFNLVSLALLSVWIIWLKILIGTSMADNSCFIRINVKQTGTSMLCLAVDNLSPCPPKMDGKQFYSSKHVGFGIGTASVRLIAKRYYGDARFEWKDGAFYASVMLNP